MFVAFMGSGGSGKTTIARALYRKLDKEGVRYIHHVSWLPKATKNIFIKSWWALRFWGYFELNTFKTYLGYAWRHRKRWPHLKDLAYMVYIAPVFVYNLKQVSKGKTDILVYDTDIIVPHADHFDETKVRHFFSNVILPRIETMLVVYVETPHDLSVKRWHVRENQALSDIRLRQLVEEREQRMRDTELLLRTLTDLPKITVIRLKGTGDPEVNAEVVLEAMREMGMKSETQNL